MHVKKILVPVDGSVHSMNAAEYSIFLAEQLNCEVLLLHCHRRFPSYLGEPELQKVIDKTLEEANRLLEPYRQLYQTAGINVAELLLEGPARTAIPDVASIENIDLIIMGSKGKSNLEGLVLGSVTHKVLHMAFCPVLVVR